MNKICTILLFLCSLTLFAQQSKIELIQGDPSKKNRVNYVCLSEGYTQQELDNGKFIQDLKSGIKHQFINAPYDEYGGHFNVWAVSVASQKSGVGGYFESVKSGRLIYLGGGGTRKVSDMLKKHKPNYDMVLVLINTTEYGGAGAAFATSSVNEQCGELILHETGHGYANLGDEYDYPGSVSQEKPNATKETNRDRIRWKVWIDQSTPVPTPETSQWDNVIGLFEGAVYQEKGWYRPKNSCKMKVLGQPFCKVCIEATIARAYKYVSPLDEYSPKDLKLHINDIPDKKLKTVLLQPTTKSVKTRWHVNGKEISTDVTLDLTKAGLVTGKNKIIAYVADETKHVINPTLFHQLRDTVEWEIDFDANNIPPSFKKSFASISVRHDALLLNSLEQENITVEIFSASGQQIKTLYKGISQKGIQVIPFQDLSKGVHFVRLRTNKYEKTFSISIK